MASGRFIPVVIISGAQAGADQGGLYAARELGIVTGGYMPKGFRTEDGKRPMLAQEFGLQEHRDWQYRPRTEANIRMADATVIFGRMSEGSTLTMNLCQHYRKPWLWIKQFNAADSIKFRLWLAQFRPDKLNVAGNRESVYPGIRERVRQFLVEEFK